MHVLVRFLALVAFVVEVGGNPARLVAPVEGVMHACSEAQSALRTLKAGPRDWRVVKTLSIWIPDYVRNYEFSSSDHEQRYQLYVSKQKRIAQLLHEQCCSNFAASFTQVPALSECAAEEMDGDAYIATLRRVHLHTRFYMQHMYDDATAVSKLRTFDLFFQQCIEPHLKEL